MRRAQEGGVLRATRGLRAWLLREEGPSGWAWVPLGRPTLVSAVAEGRYDVLSSGEGGYSVRRASVPVCETPRCRAGLEPEGEHAVRCGLSTCRAQFLPSGSARQAAWAGGVRERCPKPASVSGGGPSQSVSDLTRSHGEKALELAFDPSSLRPWRAPSLTPKPVQSFVPEGAGRGLSLALLRLWN